MSASPEVSVVIPTYNAPHFLLETVQTVLDQTFADFEVVIVNDGSTDDTAERLGPLVERDRRVRVITQENAGIGAARNRGIDESRGKYVALLDHDDLWMPGKLAAQVSYLQSHPHCVACSVNWAFSTNPQHKMFDQDLICREAGGDGTIVHRPLWQLSRGQLFLASSSTLFDRERAAGVRFATRRQCIEDTPFQIGLFARGAIGIADGQTIQMIYRWHASNYSKQAIFYYNGQQMLREMAGQGAFDELGPEDRADLETFLAMLGRTTAAKQLMAGKRGMALRAYLRELPYQLPRMRLKFLLTFPALLLAPMSVVRRALPGESV